MRRSEIPRPPLLASLEGAPDAILVTDLDGEIHLCNAAASALLACEAAGAVGRPCWEVARLITLDGRRFCGRDCAVRRMARRGRSMPRKTLARRQAGRPSMALEVTSIVIPSKGKGPSGIVHLIGRVPPRAGRRSLRLQRLSPREIDVLERIASGESTLEAAASLGVTPITLRKHVQSLMRKLGVHRRLEAVLMWIDGRGR